MPKKELIIQKLATAKGNLPYELNGYNDKSQSVINAENTNDLWDATAYLVEAQTEYSKQEKAFKDRVKEALEQAKPVKDDLAKLETAIKEKALELVKITTTTKVNNKTGEVKETQTHNLIKGAFSYTPEKIERILNKAAILNDPEKYGHVLKEVITYVIDEDKLANELLNNSNTLPYIDHIKSPRISIQSKSIIKKSLALAKEKKEEEKAWNKITKN